MSYRQDADFPVAYGVIEQVCGVSQHATLQHAEMVSVNNQSTLGIIVLQIKIMAFKSRLIRERIFLSSIPHGATILTKLFIPTVPEINISIIRKP